MELLSDSLNRRNKSNDGVLESWLVHLTLIRNTCAHHNRLWNRRFHIWPELPQRKPRTLTGQFQSGSKKLFNTLVFLLHIMDTISSDHHWRSRLVELLDTHKEYLPMMDFPTNWANREIWKVEN